MRPIIVFCFFIISLDACVDPFNIKFNGLEAALTVEGMITDKPGPYDVKIFRTSALDNQIDKIDWVKGATVVIYDDQEFSEKLSEVSPGNYQTSVNGIRGEIDRTYHIRITTSDDVIYESLPEKLLSVGDLKSLYYEFEKNVNPEEEDFLNPKNGFQLYVDAEVLPEQQNLMRWRTTGIFEIKTFPEKKMAYVGLAGGGTAHIPDPPKCSGWEYIKPNPTRGIPGGLNQLNSDCTCCNCWITQYDETPILSNPKFINDGKTVRYPIRFIPASRRVFYNKFRIEVEQMSISKSVYDFWENIKKQKETGSDLFQTPPPRTAGNIIGKTLGVPAPLGYFSAASIKTGSIIIERDKIPYIMPPIDTLTVSCQEPYHYSTNIKPVFW
jgi:hypothetical protein